MSQSDKGGLVFGGDIDGYNSYASRGNLPWLRTYARGYGPDADVRPGAATQNVGWRDGYVDGRITFIDATGVPGLYFNGGWCYGGFKATPASGFCFAHLLATGQSHKVATAYRLDRFINGSMIDEKGQGAQPNLH